MGIRNATMIALSLFVAFLLGMRCGYDVKEPGSDRLAGDRMCPTIDWLPVPSRDDGGDHLGIVEDGDDGLRDNSSRLIGGRTADAGQRPGRSPSPGQRPGEWEPSYPQIGPTGQQSSSRENLARWAEKSGMTESASPGRCPGLGEPRPFGADETCVYDVLLRRFRHEYDAEELPVAAYVQGLTSWNSRLDLHR
jgi:hypothetical protein